MARRIDRKNVDWTSNGYQNLVSYSRRETSNDNDGLPTVVKRTNNTIMSKGVITADFKFMTSFGI